MTWSTGFSKAVAAFTIGATIAGCSTTIPSPTPSPQPTGTPALAGIDALNARLGRGVNLGNALEAPKEGDWGITLQESDFRLIREAGFNSVRVPIRWSGHALNAPPYTIEPAFMQRVDWVVAQSLKQGLAVVLDMHHYDELLQSPEQQTPRFLGIWQQIASHYQNYGKGVYFELLNEPHDIPAATWNDLAARAISTIRPSNPDRAIIVGPVDYYSHRRLNDLILPADDRNLIVTFHYYLPFQFTHQSAEWVNGSSAWLGTLWQGNSSDTSNIDFDLDIAQEWGKTNHRPIYLGEFGAYSKADLASRGRWTAYVARQAEARQMSWAYWEFRAGFGVYDGASKRWNETLKKALLP